MEQIVFKRKVSEGSVTLPSELAEFLNLKDGTEVAIVADSKNGRYLKIWNNEVPRPEKKKVKKN